MPRVLVFTLLSVILIVAAAGSALAQEENYPGESFCRDVPAWPNGSYLGQMHPYHSEFYTRYAENRDWDPCVTWAADQRLSAMRGLSALGYTVIAPGETTPVAAPAPTDTANGEVPEENYPGESFCRDAPAWPNGTYLGQMHPYHSEFYTRYAENKGWDPCATWAEDQRRSAIRGLRELGHTVLEPGEAVAAPEPAPAPAAAPAPMDDADATVAYQQISGWNGGHGVLDLPAGAHEVRAEFGGWAQGPVTLSYTTPDGETVTLIDNANTGYARAFTITAPVAGSYQFQVRATNDWRISVGTPPVAAAGSGGGGGGSGGGGGGGAPGSGGDGDGDDGDNGGGIVSCTFSGWIDPGGAHYQGYGSCGSIEAVAWVYKNEVDVNGYTVNAFSVSDASLIVKYRVNRPFPLA